MSEADERTPFEAVLDGISEFRNSGGCRSLSEHMLEVLSTRANTLPDISAEEIYDVMSENAPKYVCSGMYNEVLGSIFTGEIKHEPHEAVGRIKSSKSILDIVKVATDASGEIVKKKSFTGVLPDQEKLCMVRVFVMGRDEIVVSESDREDEESDMLEEAVAREGVGVAEIAIREISVDGVVISDSINMLIVNGNMVPSTQVVPAKSLGATISLLKPIIAAAKEAIMGIKPSPQKKNASAKTIPRNA